jgi:T-complex protein 1 subunit eta
MLCAVMMQVSRHLKDFSRSVEGKQQLIIAAFAKALEFTPKQLAENAGFDSTDILNRLRQQHATEYVEC